MEVIVIGFFLLCANMLYLCVRFVIALILVQQSIVSTSILYILPALFLPVLWWMYSTKETEFNFYNRKGATLRMVMLNASLVLSQGVWRFFFDHVIVKICTLPTGRNISEGTIYALCRLLLLLSAGGACFLFFFLLSKVITKPDILESIETFRWQHVVDTRENKNKLYDLKIIRDIRSGSDVIIKEVDRFVHMFILGNSGTGKTSSTLTPSIICDLDHKIANRQQRDKDLLQLIKDGKARVARPKEGDAIDEHALKPLEGYEKVLKSARDKNPDCGITVLCPNAQLLTDVAKLAKARGLSVNLIDPVDSFDDPCVKHVGINPFIIPLDLPADELQIQISNKAQQFAEVLLAVSEMHGSSDVYFRDINTAVTSNVAAMCMLRANLNGRQTDISEIQSCINDFSLLKPVVDDIQKKLHMKINLAEIGGGKFAKQIATKEDMEASKHTARKPLQTNVPPLSDESEIPLHYREMGYTLKMYEEVLRQQAINYYEPLHYVLLELLGPGAPQMFDQARGLRNLITKLLFDPRIKRIMSASDKNYIDWDKALARGEITLINTALEIGAHGSTALGLFIMLSMKTAVMRRPLHTRSNHFLYIDEAAQYMHPMFEDMFALYRQYRVACVLAMQSLSQMEKTPLTKYLRGVIMGAGIHIVFGRLNADEMRYYETLSGMEEIDTVQKTVSHNSQLDANGRVTTMERTVTEQKSILEGHKIRSRDFQEVSVFMIDAGRVKKGFLARVAFPKEKDYFARKTNLVDWTKYADFDIHTLNLKDLTEDALMNADNEENLSAYRTQVSALNMRGNDVFSGLSDVPSGKELSQGRDGSVPALSESVPSSETEEEGTGDVSPKEDALDADKANKAEEENAQEVEENATESPLPWEKKREALLRAVDIDATFAQFEQASRAIMEKKEKEEEKLAKEKMRLAMEEEEKRREEERLIEEALEEERVKKRLEEEERENIDFSKLLFAEEKEEEEPPLKKAAGAEDLSLNASSADFAKRLLALNAQRRRDD